MPETLKMETDARGVCKLLLNRPQKHNAFDDDIIQALLSALSLITDDGAIRAVVLTGAGESFCSGADIGWMRSMVAFDRETNLEDARQLATLMRRLYALNKPTVARINGSAFGGALGLIACCDIAIAAEEARFAFTEVKLGLIPAIISPYVVAAIGPRQAKRLFLTAESITAKEAAQLNLLTHVVPSTALDDEVSTQIELLLKGGRDAHVACKGLVRDLAGIPADIDDYTAEKIASIRVSTEGQVGLRAFLNKKQPPWVS